MVIIFPLCCITISPHNKHQNTAEMHLLFHYSPVRTAKGARVLLCGSSPVAKCLARGQCMFFIIICSTQVLDIGLAASGTEAPNEKCKRVRQHEDYMVVQRYGLVKLAHRG